MEWSRARALVRDTASAHQRAGIGTVRLWVLRDNVRAGRFYLAAGLDDEEPAGMVNPFTAPRSLRSVSVTELRYSRDLTSFSPDQRSPCGSITSYRNSCGGAMDAPDVGV